VLEHASRTKPAIEAYLAIPARLPEDPATASTAVHRAGELLLRDHQTTAAWTALWRVVTDWPGEAAAGDALRTLLGRSWRDRALAGRITRSDATRRDRGRR
jgi:hypothetical protein